MLSCKVKHSYYEPDSYPLEVALPEGSGSEPGWFCPPGRHFWLSNLRKGCYCHLTALDVMTYKAKDSPPQQRRAWSKVSLSVKAEKNCLQYRSTCAPEHESKNTHRNHVIAKKWKQPKYVSVGKRINWYSKQWTWMIFSSMWLYGWILRA